MQDQEKLAREARLFAIKSSTDLESPERKALEHVARKYQSDFDRVPPLEQALILAVTVCEHFREIKREMCK